MAKKRGPRDIFLSRVINAIRDWRRDTKIQISDSLVMELAYRIQRYTEEDKECQTSAN